LGEYAAVADVLEVRGLTKSFGALRVTREVSLTLAAGEVHAVIGPNGAGKTTLIHQLSGVLLPDRGQVLLRGQNITHASPQARARAGLARSFQITSVLPEFTVLENVALSVQAHAGRAMRPWGRASADRGANASGMAALERMEMADRAHRPAGSLSHGEKRQLELAMAIAADPVAMLLDEPLAGSGPEEARRLIALLRGMKGGVAILLVEHDMDAVFALADRLTVLAEGKVIASGEPDAVRADEAVRAAYLGEDF
jgi:branched-chain amino acid transport system ATP-binding protein